MNHGVGGVVVVVVVVVAATRCDVDIFFLPPYCQCHSRPHCGSPQDLPGVRAYLHKGDPVGICGDLVYIV